MLAQALLVAAAALPPDVPPDVLDTALKSLGVSPGTLQQVFSPKTTSYHVIAPAGTTSATVTAAAHDPAARVVVGGGAPKPGFASGMFNLTTASIDDQGRARCHVACLTPLYFFLFFLNLNLY